MSVATEIEIASSPGKVREVFLDWARMSEWTQGFIRSIAPVSPSQSTVQQGDKLKVMLEGMTFSPTVLENSERQFEWRGNVPLLFHGDHYFRFEPSRTTPGGTTFSQGEQFQGPLAFLLGWMPAGAFANMKPGFEGFNNDLKRRVESLQ